jgi:hypothetical protein
MLMHAKAPRQCICYLARYQLPVTRIRRGGYIFITWIGDHPPRHVHVYHDGVLIVKWDLERDQPMEGHASARVRALLADLRAEGLL